MLKRKAIPDSEYRLTILYALTHLGPVTQLQLLQFLVDEELMNYFTMQLNLVYLQEGGYIAQKPHACGTLLFVTEAGEYMLKSFGHVLTTPVLTRIDQKAADWQSRFREEQGTLAESFPLADGGCYVRLRILEADTALLDLLLELPDARRMPDLTDRWRREAKPFYAWIISTLSDGYREGMFPESVPPEATLQDYSSNACLLSLQDDSEQPAITLMLPLPDRNLARYCACGWPRLRPGLRERLRRLLG